MGSGKESLHSRGRALKREDLRRVLVLPIIIGGRGSCQGAVPESLRLRSLPGAAEMANLPLGTAVALTAMNADDILNCRATVSLARAGKTTDETRLSGP